MRPLFSLSHVVGVLMIAYAVGVLGTPGNGVTNWIIDHTFLTPLAVAAFFAGCGAFILIARPHPALFSLATTPLLLYAIASILFFISTPTGAFTAVVAHNGLWLTVNAALIDIARRGTIPTQGADVGPTH
jgi:hypothetical protein